MSVGAAASGETMPPHHDRGSVHSIFINPAPIRFQRRKRSLLSGRMEAHKGNGSTIWVVRYR